jgi:hypothetical protein
VQQRYGIAVDGTALKRRVLISSLISRASGFAAANGPIPSTVKLYRAEMDVNSIRPDIAANVPS